MATHWTYTDFESDADLAQGDILARTDDLVALLESVHSHFSHDKYLGFLVLTQTCDLVQRKSKAGLVCKTPYISVAAVRPLAAVLPKLLDEICGVGVERVYADERRTQADNLVERILNQNEQALGLFYLHPDSDSGIAEAAVAMLRVSISFRSEHYELLRAARRGTLSHEFRSKLGWLKGNLYSRVDTTDWTEEESRSTEFKQLKRSLLGASGATWAKRSWLREARNAGVDLTEMTREDAIAKLKELAPPSPKEIAVERVKEIAATVLGPDYEAVVTKIGNRLNNDSAFKSACRSE